MHQAMCQMIQIMKDHLTAYADESVGSSGGYLDEWMQYLDTPTITVNTGDELYAQIKFEIEDEAGADGAIAGSCKDGWDSANA